jgi:Spy/CpxP family protein refolding chaperone
MKTLILSAILFMSIGTMAFAQQDSTKRVRKSPEEMAQMAADAMGTKLSLTADQKSKIYDINLESFKNAKANHESGDKRDRTSMMAAMEERDAKIKAVLNDSQRKIYEEVKAERKNHMKDNGRKGKRGNPKKA